MAINTSIQTPYQWLYNPIVEINTIGNVVETFGKVIKALKYLTQSQSASVTIKASRAVNLNVGQNFRVLEV